MTEELYPFAIRGMALRGELRSRAVLSHGGAV